MNKNVTKKFKQYLCFETGIRWGYFQPCLPILRTIGKRKRMKIFQIAGKIELKHNFEK